MEFGCHPEIWSEIRPEILELQNNPEKVFDSDLETAEDQWKKVRIRLKQLQTAQRSGSNVEFECIETVHGKLPIVKIAWPNRGK